MSMGVSRTFEAAECDEQNQRITCRECARKTLHKIVSSYEESGSEGFLGGNEVWWRRKNQTTQCLGCETVSFRIVSTFSEDYDHDENGIVYHESIEHYPARGSSSKNLDESNIPDRVWQIYAETKIALEYKQLVLTGIGIRAIVETVCKDKEAAGRSLFDKIDWLKENSIVTNEGADTLHKLRVLGNQAAHEVKAHTSPQLELALNVIEHMLDGTYVIPSRMAAVFGNGT